MPYELKESPETIQLSVHAPGREELFREALAGLLAAAYGTSLREGTSEGRFVPLQAAGGDDATLLEGLVEEALRAVREEQGTLRPPRWLAFDVDRVTVNLPFQAPKAPSRQMDLSGAEVTSGEEGWAARIELSSLPTPV